MSEVKLWYPNENCGRAEMCEWREDEKYVTSDENEFVELRDYAALERERDQLLAWLDQTQNVRDEYYALKIERDDERAELTRLRAVEELAQRFSGAVFAKAKSYWVIDAETTRMFTELAEACGRKG